MGGREIVLSSSELKRIVRLSFEQVPRMNYTPVIYAFQVSQVQSGRICKRSRHAPRGKHAFKARPEGATST